MPLRLTPEQKRESYLRRLERNRITQRKIRANLTPEQREARKAYYREYGRMLRASRTEEERKLDREIRNEWYRERRRQATPEERELRRLAKRRYLDKLKQDPVRWANYCNKVRASKRKYYRRRKLESRLTSRMS